MLGAMFRRMRIDAHAADRILHQPGGGVVTVLVMLAVIVSVMVVHEEPVPAGLTCIPYGGIKPNMQAPTKTAVLKRLSRIEGHRYCIDVVTQISAVRAALRRAEEEILRDHVAHCVEHAILSGDKADQRRKVAEIMEVLGRAER